MRIMIMNKRDSKNIGGKENKLISEYRMAYEILFYNTKDDIQFIK